MRNLVIIITILFQYFSQNSYASQVYIQGEFDYNQRRTINTLVQAIPLNDKPQSIVMSDSKDYHISLKKVSTPLSRSDLMMFADIHKTERLRFENQVNTMYKTARDVEFIITGAEILQGPRKQFLTLLVKPLLKEVIDNRHYCGFNQNINNTLLKDDCTHITLMKTSCKSKETQQTLQNYKKHINNYLQDNNTLALTIHKVMAMGEHDQPLYRGR